MLVLVILRAPHFKSIIVFTLQAGKRKKERKKKDVLRG